MLRNSLLTASVLTLLLLFTACEKDPVIPHEEELITTITYTLTPADGGTAISLSFKDLDGDGGNDPTITGGILAANQTYTGVLELWNEAETPAENITLEIETEDAEHQFFFQPTVSQLVITYNDQDIEGNPVGLQTTLATGDAASGSLKIILRHEPNKSASGVAGGDISNAGGETDIEVTFPVDVQ